MAVSDDFGGDVQLTVAFNSKNTFMGLLAESEAGLHARGDGRWFRVTPDNRFFIGAQVVDVDEKFLAEYDKLDAEGVEPTLEQVEPYIISDETDEEVESE